MRPDEHKRKKNADYKKKHGIPAKRESKKEELRKEKSEKPQNSEEKQEIPPRNNVSKCLWFSDCKVSEVLINSFLAILKLCYFYWVEGNKKFFKKESS